MNRLHWLLDIDPSRLPKFLLLCFVAIVGHTESSGNTVGTNGGLATYGIDPCKHNYTTASAGAVETWPRPVIVDLVP